MASSQVDVSALSAEEQELYKRYGKLPSKKPVHARLNGGERRFFDSADHALGASGNVGSVIATANNIPKHKPAPKPSNMAKTGSSNDLKKN